MSIQAADLKKLVKIVRQYEVIYGGGISTSDAAVREECEKLVARLESEMGITTSRRVTRGSMARSGSLPSLVDAKSKRIVDVQARPVASRASELAQLTSAPKKTETSRGKSAAASVDAGKAGKNLPERPEKGKTAQGKTERQASGKATLPAKGDPRKSAAAGKAAAKEIAPKAGAAKAGAAKTDAAVSGKGGKQTVSVAAKPEAKAIIDKRGSAGPTTARKGDASDKALLSQLRSRDVGAAKAADERAERITGRTGKGSRDEGEQEPRRRFAAQHLFDAYQQNKLPKYGGFIVCVRFSDEQGYTVVEIIGYENLQDIYPEGETLVFKSVGCKLYAIVEPATYLLKSVEPVNRPSEQAVPYRFAELLRITTKRFQTIMVGRKPVFMPTSFSVFKPMGEDVAVLFYDIADVYSNIQDFLIMILRDRLGVPVPDSRKAAEVIARGIREFRLWLDEA